jgi:hypothetical protein
VEFGNISTRLSVGTANNVLIGGFIVTGTQPKKVVIRAIGPSLIAFGVPGLLANPTLELHDSTGAVISSNDNWVDSANKQAIIDSRLAPTSNLESAILMTLNPGAYTAIVSGVNATIGVALVEVYDLDSTVDSKLANISTRGFVQTGDDVMIGGLIVLGTQPANTIIRAIGPSLPLAGTLADPTLELHDGNGTIIASNDNWKDTQESAIQATGVAPPMMPSPQLSRRSLPDHTPPSFAAPTTRRGSPWWRRISSVIEGCRSSGENRNGRC